MVDYYIDTTNIVKYRERTYHSLKSRLRFQDHFLVVLHERITRICKNLFQASQTFQAFKHCYFLLVNSYLNYLTEPFYTQFRTLKTCCLSIINYQYSYKQQFYILDFSNLLRRILMCVFIYLITNYATKLGNMFIILFPFNC